MKESYIDKTRVGAFGKVKIFSVTEMFLNVTSAYNVCIIIVLLSAFTQ